MKNHIGKLNPADVDTFLGQLKELAKVRDENNGYIVEMVEKGVSISMDFESVPNNA